MTEVAEKPTVKQLVGRIVKRFNKPQRPQVESTQILEQPVPPETIQRPIFTPLQQTDPEPSVSRSERRTAKKAAYKASRTTSQPDTSDKDSNLVKPAVEQHDRASQDSSNLPSIFKEVEKFEKQMRLTKSDLPWLSEDENLSLVRITLKDNQGEFLFGSAIRGKQLTQAAASLDQHRSKIASNLLYTHLPDIITQGNSPFASVLVNKITERQIFYFGNKGGQRVYFMRFENMDNMPVIVRIAVCDKSDQVQVLSVLTDKSRSFNKKRGRV